MKFYLGQKRIIWDLATRIGNSLDQNDSNKKKKKLPSMDLKRRAYKSSASAHKEIFAKDKMWNKKKKNNQIPMKICWTHNEHIHTIYIAHILHSWFRACNGYSSVCLLHMRFSSLIRVYLVMWICISKLSML